LSADSELSVKNGAELLDRLVKDIVSESAASYVSITQARDESAITESKPGIDSMGSSMELPTAFSLSKFIPLLQERIHVMNPFTRTFLVSWVTLLDTIPDLELVTYLPSFLAGLFKFLSDPNRDVQVITGGCLERFLKEIKKIASIKKGLEESRRSQSESKAKLSDSSDAGSTGTNQSVQNEKSDVVDGEAEGEGDADGGDWIPGQDVQVDHPKILEILVSFLDPTTGTCIIQPWYSSTTN
jgi:vacuole morphology and inheritance protein 14